MNVEKKIELLCNAITCLHEAWDLVTHIELVDGKIPHTKGNLWTAAHTLQSQPANMVRELWKELPDRLKTEEITKHVSNLFPHLYEADDYKGMRESVFAVHEYVHQLSRDMRS